MSNIVGPENEELLHNGRRGRGLKSDSLCMNSCSERAQSCSNVVAELDPGCIAVKEMIVRDSRKELANFELGWMQQSASGL